MTRKFILLFSAIVAFLVALFAGAGIYFWVMNSKSEIVVPISVQDIKTGHAITEEDITTVKINPNAATSAIVYNINDLVGNYCLRNMGPNEYFYKNWISPSYARKLTERMRYTAVIASTDQMRSVNGEIKEDDFVKITIITSDDGANNNLNDPNTLTTNTPVKLIEPPELSAVRVLGIYDGSGIDINEKKALVFNPDGSIDPNASIPQGSFIIFDCTDIQRALIIQAEHMGIIQLVLLPEADQQAERIKWGLAEPEDDEDQYLGGKIDVGIDYSEPQGGNTPTPGSEDDLNSQEARRNELVNMQNEKQREIIAQAAEQQGVVLDDVELSNTTGSVSVEGKLPEEQPNQQG